MNGNHSVTSTSRIIFKISELKWLNLIYCYGFLLHTRDVKWSKNKYVTNNCCTSRCQNVSIFCVCLIHGIKTRHHIQIQITFYYDKMYCQTNSSTRFQVVRFLALTLQYWNIISFKFWYIEWIHISFQIILISIFPRMGNINSSLI